MLDIVGTFSKLLIKCGIDTYLARVEFAAHLGWSIAISLLGIFLGNMIGVLVVAGWIIMSFYDEFAVDGWKGEDKGYDTLWDLNSKVLIPIGALCYLILKNA
jgi:hypothetical protein